MFPKSYFRIIWDRQPWDFWSEGSSPLAFEIYRQTAAFGNAFVFLMAGVVTDYTEIGLLWTNVGKRVALFLPLIAVPQVIVLGIVANIVW